MVAELSQSTGPAFQRLNLLVIPLALHPCPTCPTRLAFMAFKSCTSNLPPYVGYRLLCIELGLIHPCYAVTLRSSLQLRCVLHSSALGRHQSLVQY